MVSKAELSRRQSRRNGTRSGNSGGSSERGRSPSSKAALGRALNPNTIQEMGGPWRDVGKAASPSQKAKLARTAKELLPKFLVTSTSTKAKEKAETKAASRTSRTPGPKSPPYGHREQFGPGQRRSVAEGPGLGGASRRRIPCSTSSTTATHLRSDTLTRGSWPPPGVARGSTRLALRPQTSFTRGRRLQQRNRRR